MCSILDFTQKLPRHPVRRWSTRPLASITQVIIHQELGEASIEAVNAYHLQPNHISSKGCPRFCYHYGIRKNGEIIQANTLTDITWHCSRQNATSIGIMVVGNFNGVGHDLGTSTPTKHQLAALDHLVRYLLNSFALTHQAVHGHYHFGKPACPGHVLQEWVETFRKSDPDLDALPEKSESVIRQLLHQLGYIAHQQAGEIDLVQGIRLFQKHSELETDGIVGPATWKALLELTTTTNEST